MSGGKGLLITVGKGFTGTRLTPELKVFFRSSSIAVLLGGVFINASTAILV